MSILDECLKYFKKIDINFDLYIIADTQERTAQITDYINHADESEFFSRKEFADIASALFYIIGFAKVFYSEIDFIEYVLKEKPTSNDCYIYNFSRDGVSEGKKSLIPSFCDLCGLRYTGSNAFTISLLRNKWFFSQVLRNFNILMPKTIFCSKTTLKDIEIFKGETVLVKNVFESASQGLHTDNRLIIKDDYTEKLIETMERMDVEQILVQQYIEGLECEVLVIQFKNKYYALEPIEVVINGNDFLDSDTSNSYNYSFRKLADSLNFNIVDKIKHYAIVAADTLKIKDYARFDFRINEDQPYLIDIAGTPYTIKHSSIDYLFEEIMHLEYQDIYKVILACSVSNYNTD